MPAVGPSVLGSMAEVRGEVMEQGTRTGRSHVSPEGFPDLCRWKVAADVRSRRHHLPGRPRAPGSLGITVPNHSTPQKPPPLPLKRQSPGDQVTLTLTRDSLTLPLGALGLPPTAHRNGLWET